MLGKQEYRLKEILTNKEKLIRNVLLLFSLCTVNRARARMSMVTAELVAHKNRPL